MNIENNSIYSELCLYFSTVSRQNEQESEIFLRLFHNRNFDWIMSVQQERLILTRINGPKIERYDLTDLFLSKIYNEKSLYHDALQVTLNTFDKDHLLNANSDQHLILKQHIEIYKLCYKHHGTILSETAQAILGSLKENSWMIRYAADKAYLCKNVKKCDGQFHYSEVPINTDSTGIELSTNLNFKSDPKSNDLEFIPLKNFANLELIASFFYLNDLKNTQQCISIDEASRKMLHHKEGTWILIKTRQTDVYYTLVKKEIGPNFSHFSPITASKENICAIYSTLKLENKYVESNIPYSDFLENVFTMQENSIIKLLNNKKPGTWIIKRGSKGQTFTLYRKINQHNQFMAHEYLSMNKNICDDICEEFGWDFRFTNSTFTNLNPES